MKYLVSLLLALSLMLPAAVIGLEPDWTFHVALKFSAPKPAISEVTADFENNQLQKIDSSLSGYSIVKLWTERGSSTIHVTLLFSAPPPTVQQLLGDLEAGQLSIIDPNLPAYSVTGIIEGD